MRRKFLLLWLIFQLISSATSNQDCSVLPPGLKSLNLCCDTPNFFHYRVQQTCSEKCGDSTCKFKCYLDEISVNDKLNKTILLNVYLGADEIWREIYQNSFDKCEISMNSKSTPEEKIIELYSCFKREASKNCLEFHSNMGCSKTEKFFEDCQNSKSDCSVWPSKFHSNTISSCCNVPNLISYEKQIDCDTKCRFSSDSLYRCTEECFFNIEKFFTDKKLDLKLVKKILDENRNQSLPWEKVIDDVVESCFKTHKNEHKTELFENSNMFKIFYVCVYDQLSLNCADFLDVGMATGCYGYVKYRKTCPDSKPTKKF